MLIAVFLVIFGAGPSLSESKRGSAAFLSMLLARLNKNSSEKVMHRVDSGTGRSTDQ